MKFVLAVVLSLCVGALAKPSKFLPTRNGGATPEVFWYPTDNGIIVPALLHGKPTHFESKGISDDVQFYHYSSKNPSVKTELLPGCSGCLTTFVIGAPVYFLAHGFSSSSEGGFGEEFRENFAKAEGEYNLIFINWEKLAAAPWYEFAADNTKPVGEWTGELIKFLLDQGVTTIADINYAGHSLGSHIANFIAHNISSAGLKLARVNALDPALPLFGEREDDERIDPTDADFVNVIHTSMGTLLDGGLAFTEPRGHSDFYPNSGKHQPNCGADLFGACSHSRSHQYFGESVNRPNGFVGCQCESWADYVGGICDCKTVALMGFATPPNTRGVYYLHTNGNPPYGIGA